MSKLCLHAYGSGEDAAVAGPIDTLLDELEAPLAALAQALHRRDPAALEQQAVALQAALAAALPRLRQPVAGNEPQRTQPRLALAQAHLAALRECVARENAAAARGLALLMPAPQQAAMYGTMGQAERAATHGSLCA